MPDKLLDENVAGKAASIVFERRIPKLSMLFIELNLLL
jgi:hypothetical protein